MCGLQNKDQNRNEESRDYFFSDVREIYKYIAIEFYSNDPGNRLGFMVLSISKDKGKTIVKLLDFNLQHDDKYSIILNLVMQYSAKYKADKVEVSDEFSQLLSKVIKPSLLNKQKRIYLYFMSDMSDKVALALPSIKPNYCDGDLPFY